MTYARTGMWWTSPDWPKLQEIARKEGLSELLERAPDVDDEEAWIWFPRPGYPLRQGEHCLWMFKPASAAATEEMVSAHA